MLPHAVFFGYRGRGHRIVHRNLSADWVSGCALRAFSGCLFLINMLLAAWWEPGHGVPIWRYFGARLDHMPLLLLLIIFLPQMPGGTGVSTAGSARIAVITNYNSAGKGNLRNEEDLRAVGGCVVVAWLHRRTHRLGGWPCMLGMCST